MLSLTHVKGESVLLPANLAQSQSTEVCPGRCGQGLRRSGCHAFLIFKYLVLALLILGLGPRSSPGVSAKASRGDGEPDTVPTSPQYQHFCTASPPPHSPRPQGPSGCGRPLLRAPSTVGRPTTVLMHLAVTWCASPWGNESGQWAFLWLQPLASTVSVSDKKIDSLALGCG